jgi:hypothetical protein
VIILKRTYFVFITLLIMLSPIAGCGGGGGSSLASVTGILTDGFGAVITSPGAILTLEGSDVIGSPNENGKFLLSAAPGNYILTGSWFNEAAGIRLEGKRTVQLTSGNRLDVGFFNISDQALDSAWTNYNAGNFSAAESLFLEYLDKVRSGQADTGSSSAYNGLGWTRGRGLNDPVQSAIHFEEALSGWNGNVDAWAGLSAAELSRMRSDGIFHFNQSVMAINAAIDGPGVYSSAPTHDVISETDLRAFRSFVNYLNGNLPFARTEALAIQNLIPIEGNQASATAVSVVIRFSE